MGKKARSRPEPNPLVLFIEGHTGLKLGCYKTELAEAIHLSPPAFSNRMAKGLFTYEEMRVILRRLKATDEDILKLMK